MSSMIPSSSVHRDSTTIPISHSNLSDNATSPIHNIIKSTYV